MPFGVDINISAIGGRVARMGGEAARGTAQGLTQTVRGRGNAARLIGEAIGGGPTVRAGIKFARNKDVRLVANLTRTGFRGTLPFRGRRAFFEAVGDLPISDGTLGSYDRLVVALHQRARYLNLTNVPVEDFINFGENAFLNVRGSSYPLLAQSPRRALLTAAGAARDIMTLRGIQTVDAKTLGLITAVQRFGEQPGVATRLYGGQLLRYIGIDVRQGVVRGVTRFASGTIFEQLLIEAAFRHIPRLPQIFEAASNIAADASQRFISALESEFLDPLSAYEQQFYNEMTVLSGELLRGPRSQWPVLTGFSRGRFITERQGRVISVYNDAHYASILEFSPRSRHRDSARNTIEDNIDNLTRTANRRAISVIDVSGSSIPDVDFNFVVDAR